MGLKNKDNSFFPQEKFVKKGRMDRVNIFLKEKVGEILNREVVLGRDSALITVDKVETAADLKTAKVFLSVFPTKMGKIALDKVSKVKSLIQKELGERIRLKYTPRLNFMLNPFIIEEERIEKIFNKINHYRQGRQKRKVF